jgi:hypothetical protein
MYSSFPFPSFILQPLIHCSNIGNRTPLHRTRSLQIVPPKIRLEDPPRLLRIRLHYSTTRERGRRKLRTSCFQVSAKYGGQIAESGSEGTRRGR